MSKLVIKTLVTLGVLAATSAAFATPVTLVADQLRTGGGTLYTKFNTGSTATWDWDWGTKTLTQTGGTYYATRNLSNNMFAPSLETDQITGLVINTVAMTTTATSYQCNEGTFGVGVGASICGNVNLGGDFVLDSALNYNFGGNADCIEKVIANDDSDGGALRGLTTHGASGSCTAQIGAFERYTAQVIGGYLVLNNGIGIGSPNSIQFTFSGDVVPVPAAVWLFGSALGLLGVARRRAA